MNNFHFLRPEWFLILPPLLLLLLWFARQQLRSQSWRAVCDPELLQHLLIGRSVRRANWPFWLLLTGLLLTVLTLAGPVWQRQPKPLFRQQSGLVILFDLSRSMQAADLEPSRFLRARLKIEDLLRQRDEGQTALIVFAADAFTVTPLTEDRHTIEALLRSLDPEMMPVQGSDPARAIELGQDLLRQAGLKSGRLLLVTDEDRPERSLDAASALPAQGYKLDVLGVGSIAGAPIPQPESGFLKDSQGRLVMARLNPSGLRALAQAGGGDYQMISIDGSDLRTLLSGKSERRLDHAEQAEQDTSSTGEDWREEGIWLLWPLSLLAALAFRRGWLMVLPLLLLNPSPAGAISWEDLWKTSDQQAADAFHQGDYSSAAEQFRDHRWKASALFRAGDYEAAAKQLETSSSADDWYNRGNALAKAGNLPAALKSYQQALEIEQGHDDALANKQIVEQALKQQRQEQQEQLGGQKNKPGDQQEQNQQQGQPGTGENQAQGQPALSGQQKRQDVAEKQQNDAGNGADTSQDGNPATQSTDPEGDQEQAPKTEETASPETGVTYDQQKEAPGDEPKQTDQETYQNEARLLLQRIPDDPGGLLRRKFLYQYRQRGQQRESDRPW